MNEKKLFENQGEHINSLEINDIELLDKIAKRYQEGKITIQKAQRDVKDESGEIVSSEEYFKLLSKRYDGESGDEISPRIMNITIADLGRMKTKLQRYADKLDRMIAKLESIE